jgi:hypothetical protein
MIAEVHHQIDRVWVRTDAGLYHDTPENFHLDCVSVGIGEVLPELPDGAIERIYQQGVRHAIQDGISVVGGGEIRWPLGDEIIERISKLLSAQETRQPVKKKISPEEVKRAEIEQAYVAQAYGELESSALGTPHFYLIDQAEITAAVVHGLKTTPVWCRDEDDAWALRKHTLVQLRKVFADFRSAILVAQRHRADLLAKLDNGGDIDAIKW